MHQDARFIHQQTIINHPKKQMKCLECASTKTEIIETRMCMNGTRRRRRKCHECGYRWTEWDGKRPGIYKPTLVKEEHVRLALTRPDLTDLEVAHCLGCSNETIRKIRCGIRHRDILPELLRYKERQRPQPNANKRNCTWCEHWAQSRCSFGFPDPLTEGLGFAADCDLYQVCDKALTGHATAASCPVGGV